jgi:hypothetical protein
MIRAMRPVIIAANWKMNTTPADAGELAATIAARTSEPSVERVICPPFVCLAAVGDALRGTGVAVGAQDVHHELAGAYTGDISAPMLAGLATWVIVGHSERRRDHAETDERISRSSRGRSTAACGRSCASASRSRFATRERLPPRRSSCSSCGARPAARCQRARRCRPRDRLRAGLGDRDGPERERRRRVGDGRGDPRGLRALGWGDSRTASRSSTAAA